MSRFISTRTTGGTPITINVSHIVYASEDGGGTSVVLSAGAPNTIINKINIAIRYSEFIDMVKAEDYV